MTSPFEQGRAVAKLWLAEGKPTEDLLEAARELAATSKLASRAAFAKGLVAVLEKAERRQVAA